MFGFGRRQPAPPDRRILLDVARPAFVYVIGDVHGCLAQLQSLEDNIAEHAQRHGQNLLLVYLGDLIDRGPDSYGVVEYLSSRRKKDRMALTGNHEAMFVDFLANPSPRHAWLKYGGVETLQSYGIDATTLFDGGRNAAQHKLGSYIPDDHVEFLKSLPLCISWPGLTLVHAGLREDVAIDRQSPDDMIWLRMPVPAFSQPQPFGLLVHGHTPSVAPVVEPYRICIDTGAYATGTLSAIAIDLNNQIEIITS